MELSAWISIASICAVGAMSPGPSLAVVIRNTVSGGRLQGVLTGVGHALGVGIYASAAVFGVAVLLGQYPAMVRGIELLGGGYLLWLGVQAFLHADKKKDGAAADSQHLGFVDGFAISGLNPKIAVFFLALLGPFIPPEASSAERLCVAAMAMLIDGSWYVTFAIGLTKTGAAGWLSRHGAWLDRILSVLLVGVGIWLIAR